MFIDSLTIAAIVVFVGVMGLMVNNCVLNSFIRPSDRKDYDDSAQQSGGKR